MKKKRRESLLPEVWEPMMGEMASLKKSMDAMFDRFFSIPTFSVRVPSLFKSKLADWKTEAWKPEIDMYETDKAVVVKANVPGCDKKDLKLHIEDNVLTISGEKKEEKEVKKKNFYQKEHHAGIFRRSISLPGYVNVDKAKASCNKGVVEVRFPKLKTGKGKAKTINLS